MKKILLIISTILLSVFAFVGCDPKVEDTPTGISFVQESFYVDDGVATKLEYKVYPSTAKGYSIDYIVTPGDAKYTTYYNFSKETGIFEAKNGIPDGYEADDYLATITIKMGPYQDTCYVYLRLYPNSVKFESSQYTIKNGGSLSLPILKEVESGVFNNCQSNEYRYKITSSNPNIIAVEEEQSLLVKSTGINGLSEVTVESVDMDGNNVNGLSAKTTIKVEDCVDEESTYVYISNAKSNYMIEQGKECVYIDVQAGEEFNIVAKFFDVNGFLLEGTQCSVYVSYQKIAEVDGTTIRITEKPTQKTIIGVTLIANNTNADGEVVVIEFDLVLDVTPVETPPVS